MSNVTVLQRIRNRAVEFLGGSTKPAARTSLFTEQATDTFLRFMSNMADPDEVLRKAGITRVMLRALTGDDEITAALDTRREALLSTEWRLEAQSDTPEELMAYVEEQFTPHAERFLRACMEALPFGYSVQEAIYIRTAEGRVGIAELTEKPFEWFVPRLDGTVLWRSVQRPQGEETDPRKYFLTARGQTYRNPYGEAIFSRLYWPWLFRTAGWKFWVRWLERFGNPFLVGQTGGDAKTMNDALVQAQNSATISVGMGDKVEMLGAQGGGEQFATFERAVVARYQRSILGQTLTSDAGGSSGKSGSYAAAKVHNEVRLDKRNADCRMCMVTGQKLVDVLWTLNAFPGSPPRFVIQDSTGLESERAERDALLVSKTGLKLTPEYFVRVYDFLHEDLNEDAMNAATRAALSLADRRDNLSGDDPGDDDPAVKGDGPNDNGGPSEQGKPKKKPAKDFAALFARHPFTPRQQEIENGIDATLDRIGDALGDAEIKAAIRASTTRDELVANLTALLADAPRSQFREVMERALFAADVLGYIHANERAEP